MAESPSTKPTDSFSWPATTNGTSEPSSGLRNAGWAPGDAPPATEFNWWWQRMGGSLDWLRALAVRRFTTLAEAVRATEVGDTFMLAPPFVAAQSQAVAYIGVGFVPVAIACDGRRFYVASANATGDVAAFESDGGTTPTAVWSRTGLDDIDPNEMSADGGVVAIANGITGSPTPKSVLILDASDGSTLYTDPATGSVRGIVADTMPDGTKRAWWGTAASGNANIIYSWTGASKTTRFSGLYAVRGMAVGGDLLVYAASPDGTLCGLTAQWRDDTSTALLWSVTFAADVARTQAVATDGERVFWLINGASGGDVHRLRCYSGATGALLWDLQLEDITLSEARRLRVDDRYVYATWMRGVPPSNTDAVAIVCKWTGALVGLLDPSDAIAGYANSFDVDGVHAWLLMNGEAAVARMGTNRQPSLWRRESHVTSRPHRRLARCIGGNS